MKRQGKTEVDWADRHARWLALWAQRRNRQPVLQQITPGRSVASGYMEWFYGNGKPFIMTREALVKLERPRQQRGPRPTGASTGSTHQTGGSSSATGPGVAAEGPSAEPYTPMPPFFNYASSSQFHSPYTPMPPPTEGFFARTF
ncbi:hypothetical protein V6N13_071464 [Hibiscus sabdariffa]